MTEYLLARVVQVALTQQTTVINVTGWQMEKIFNHKSFNYFVWTPLGVELSYRYIFAFKLTLRSQQPDIVPIICRRCH